MKEHSDTLQSTNKLIEENINLSYTTKKSIETKKDIEKTIKVIGIIIATVEVIAVVSQAYFQMKSNQLIEMQNTIIQSQEKQQELPLGHPTNQNTININCIKDSVK